jgi:hypothetical protein
VLRRTNLFNIVNNESRKDIRRDWAYQLPAYGGLYIPSASVFRSNESTGYKYLVSPIKLSFLLASAPLNMPRDKPNTNPRCLSLSLSLSLSLFSLLSSLLFSSLLFSSLLFSSLLFYLFSSLSHLTLVPTGLLPTGSAR